jgi:hypothetical protein
MFPTEDQDVIQAFVSDRAHPPLGNRVRLRRPDRRLDQPHALGAHDLVEGAGELGVAVVQQEATFTNRSSIARLRACWHNQAQSGLAVTPARCTRRDPSSIEKSTYSVRRETVSTAKKSQASTPCAWARGNSLHDGPPRRGAGPRPRRLRIILIVGAPTLMPSLRSSPWMRTQPLKGVKTPIRRSGLGSATMAGVWGAKIRFARAKAVICRQDANFGTPHGAARSSGAGAGCSTRTREPRLGLPADRRRAAEPWHGRFGDLGADNPRPPWAAAGAAARRALVAQLPPPTGGDPARLRFLHRRDRLAETNLRALLHLA